MNPVLSTTDMVELAQIELPPLEIGRTFEVEIGGYMVNCPIEITYKGQKLLLQKVMGSSKYSGAGLYEFDTNGWRHRNHYGPWINANTVLEVGQYYFFRGSLYHG